MKNILLPCFLAMAFVLAGCGSAPKGKEVDIGKMCKPSLVRTVMANQQELGKVEAGTTFLRDLNRLGRPARVVTLSHFGERPLQLMLYPTAVPSCPFVLREPVFQPLVVNEDGLVVGIGVFAVRDLTAKGWRMREATWPWQDYNFAYLPSK